jgi:hypothetical protein
MRHPKVHTDKMKWDSVAMELIKRKDEWSSLPFFEQSNWKCKFYGIEPENFKEIIWSSI